VAASWPVRHIDAYRARRLDPPWVIGNRGTSGIDGIVATAWGAAVAFQRPPALWEITAAEATGEPVPAPGGPTVSLLGDLAFVYDQSALLVPQAEEQPNLTLVVLDNDGGGIFSTLEAAQTAPPGEFERVMGTPLGRDLAALATAAGYRTVTVSTPGDLADALMAALPQSGVDIIVCLTGDRQVEAQIVAQIRRELGDALAAGGQ
jgi:2-succinyl-5-enolpyruvyl-6-hydroxy-3-cyclohexene-1-carboxylate synthase